MGPLKALIDADNIAFACAASAEDATLEIAISRTNDMLEGLLEDTQADEYELWLSGPKNFRRGIYPEYKAPRLGAYRPKWEKGVKEYMVEHWQANWSDGVEADDMLGIRQMQEMELNTGFGLAFPYQEGYTYYVKDDIKYNTVICHLDKDLNQIPGWHFNWELNRLGKTIREKRKYFVDHSEAYRFFCYQLIVGDPTDNIKGVVGSGPKAAEALLGNVPQQYWYEEIRNLYASEEELDMNAQCVYIWRKEKDHWKNLVEQYHKAGPMED